VTVPRGKSPMPSPPPAGYLARFFFFAARFSFRFF
jgi:hypothetical protein